MRTIPWKDVGPRGRAIIISLAVVQVALLAAALIDIRRRPADRIRGGKRRWAAISFIDFAGPIAYFAYGRRRP